MEETIGRRAHDHLVPFVARDVQFVEERELGSRRLARVLDDMVIGHDQVGTDHEAGAITLLRNRDPYHGVRGPQRLVQHVDVAQGVFADDALAVEIGGRAVVPPDFRWRRRRLRAPALAPLQSPQLFPLRGGDQRFDGVDQQRQRAHAVRHFEILEPADDVAGEHHRAAFPLDIAEQDTALGVTADGVLDQRLPSPDGVEIRQVAQKLNEQAAVVRFELWHGGTSSSAAYRWNKDSEMPLSGRPTRRASPASARFAPAPPPCQSSARRR